MRQPGAGEAGVGVGESQEATYQLRERGTFLWTSNEEEKRK